MTGQGYISLSARNLMIAALPVPPLGRLADSAVAGGFARLASSRGLVYSPGIADPRNRVPLACLEVGVDLVSIRPAAAPA